MTKSKIRRLASPESGKVPTKRNKSHFCQICISIVVVLGASFIVTQNLVPECEMQTLLNALDTLHDNYEQHYNSIVQGDPEYCKQSLDVVKMFLEIGREVLNQENALNKIQSLFTNSTKFRGILVAGSPGVGKTLFGTQLIENFNWKNNVQKYVLNNFNEEVKNHSQLYGMLDNLSTCGENLIIVDNLEPTDLKEIEDFRTKAADKLKQLESNGRLVNLTVIFLVTIPNYNDVQKTEYDQHLETFSSIKTLETVIFKSFGKTEILACIKQVIAKESLNIKDSEIQEILNSIDPESGCKKVFVKTAVYSEF